MPGQELTFSSSSPSLGQVNHEFEDSVGCSESYMPGGATNQEELV